MKSKNTGKHIDDAKIMAAIAVLAMTCAGLAVIVSEDFAEDVAADGADPLGTMITNATYSDKTYTLSNDSVITLTTNVNLEGYRFVGDHKVTISGGTLTVNGVSFEGDVEVSAGAILKLDGDGAMIAPGKNLIFASPPADYSAFSFIEATAGAKLVLDSASLEIKFLGGFMMGSAALAGVGIKTTGAVTMTFTQAFERGDVGGTVISGGEKVTITDIFPLKAGAEMRLETPAEGSIALLKDGSSSAKLTVAGNGSFSGTVHHAVKSYPAEYSGLFSITSSASVTTSGFAPADGSTLTFVPGSVVISGSLTAAEVEARISSATSDVILDNLTLTSGTLTISESVKVGSGGLAVDPGAEISIGAGKTLTIEPMATVVVAGKVSGNVDNGGKVITTSTADVSGITIDPASSGTVSRDSADDVSTASYLIQLLGAGVSSITMSADIDLSGHAADLTVASGVTLNGGGKNLTFGPNTLTVHGSITDIGLRVSLAGDITSVPAGTYKSEVKYADGELVSIAPPVPPTPPAPIYDDDDYYNPVVPVAPASTSDDSDKTVVIACAAAAVAAALAVVFFLVDSRRP